MQTIKLAVICDSYSQQDITINCDVMSQRQTDSENTQSLVFISPCGALKQNS